MDIDTCLNVVLFPANALESYAYSYPCSYEQHGSCLKSLVQRLVTLVAPIFHLYECLVSIVRVPMHLLTFCCTENELKDLLFDKKAGAIICALNAIRNCLSSIFEIPEKLVCGGEPTTCCCSYGNTVNYFGTNSRYEYRLIGNKWNEDDNI